MGTSGLKFVGGKDIWKCRSETIEVQWRMYSRSLVVKLAGLSQV